MGPALHETFCSGEQECVGARDNLASLHRQGPKARHLLWKTSTQLSDGPFVTQKEVRVGQSWDTELESAALPTGVERRRPALSAFPRFWCHVGRQVPGLGGVKMLERLEREASLV